MASNVDIVKKNLTNFLNSKQFWFVIVFIILAGFYIYITDPKIPQVDYVGYDEDGNPVSWNDFNDG